VNNHDRTLVALFDDVATAQQVANELERNGFSSQDIDIQTGNAASDVARGNAGLSGTQSSDASGGGLSTFFRRLFGQDDHDDARVYGEAVRRGGALVSVNVDSSEEDRAAEIMERYGAVDVDTRRESYRSGSSVSGMGNATTDREVIPVVQEELAVGKRQVQKGGVRIVDRTENRPIEEQINLREEHVRVERHPVNRPATDADLRAHDQVIEVTEMAEEPIVDKRARVVEEVVVGKEATQRTETIRDTVRRSDVDVQKLGTEHASMGRDFDDREFRTHFESNYGRQGRYEDFAPAYRYGYQMAGDERYRGSRWEDVETRLRGDYERQYPGSTWDQIKGSVRYGWERMTGRR
jgi:uncharacterized protein (TIGR02271 family)